MADEQDSGWITTELRRSAVSERAPSHLRRQLDEVSARAGRRRTRPRAFRRLTLLPAAGVLAAIIVALVLVLGGGTSVSPAIARAAAIGARAALPPATLSPGAEQSQGVIPIYSTGGHFPDWRSNGGWHEEGFGLDHLDGRALVTVDYAHGRQLVAYSIAEAPVLAGQRAGFSSFTLGHRTVVSWTEAGQSCLLSSVNVPRATLLKLARS